MDFKSLHYVLAVAERGGISSAAKALGIAQPSLSKYLQNVTDGLGVDLFERKGGKLVPTFAGERYIAYSRQILAMAKELDNISPKTRARPLRVTCPPFEGIYIHPFAVRQFAEKHPEDSILMIESNDTASLLRSGQADFAITTSPPVGREFVKKLLIKDEILLVASKSNKLVSAAVWRKKCSQPWIDVNLLWGESLIRLYPDQRTRVLSDELLRREKVYPKILMQTRSVLNAIQIAATGVAVCFAPAMAIRNFHFSEQPAQFSIGDPVVMDVYCVHLESSPLSELSTKFLKHVKNFIK